MSDPDKEWIEKANQLLSREYDSRTAVLLAVAGFAQSSHEQGVIQERGRTERYRAALQAITDAHARCVWNGEMNGIVASARLALRDEGERT